MPLSSPAGGDAAVNNNFPSLGTTTIRRIQNPLGPDAVINFFGIAHNPANGDIAIGGNNSFTGILSSIRPNLVTQHATLFSSVIATGDARRMIFDFDNNGLIVQSGNASNAFARTDDGGASWTALGALRAFSYSGAAWWNSQIVALVANTNGDNIDISSDGGATFPVTADTQRPGNQQDNFLYTNDTKTHLVSCSNQGISWTVNSNLTVPGNWNSILLAAEGVTSGVASMAINPAGTHCVVCAQTGHLIVSSDSLATFAQWPPGLNPFRNNNNPSFNPSFCIYIASISSFLILGAAGSPVIGFLITEDEIASLSGGTVAAYLGSSSATTSTQAMIGTNVIIVGDRIIAPINANSILANW